jgi:uncharacterized membrane protein YhaH (DUF805 family)
MQPLRLVRLAGNGAMIRESFSFDGTIGRRDFLVRLLVLGFGQFLMMLGVVFAVRVLGVIPSPSRRPIPVYEIVGAVAAVASIMLPCVWAFYALAAKRLRSIGLDPALVILVSLTIGLYESWLFKPAFGQAELLGYWASPVGHIWDLLFIMVLVLWPQRPSLARQAARGATYA